MFKRLFSRNKIESTKSDVNSNFSEKDDKEKEVKSIESNEIYLTDNEIEYFIEKEIKKRISETEGQGISNEKTHFDPLFKESAVLIVASQQGSTSLIQRKFTIGYNRAGRIIDQLESAGILGPFDGSKAREVLVKNTQDLKRILEGKLLKENYFYENILLDKIDFIQSKVDEYFKNKEIELENELKESLRQQLLQEQKEKIEKQRINQLKEQVRLEMLQNGLIIDEVDEETKNREPIPQEIQDRVWNRDGGICVKCGSREKLEFDHIIPFSKGGSNTYRNLQLLCEKCNRQKSNKIG